MYRTWISLPKWGRLNRLSSFFLQHKAIRQQLNLADSHFIHSSKNMRALLVPDLIPRCTDTTRHTKRTKNWLLWWDPTLDIPAFSRGGTHHPRAFRLTRDKEHKGGVCQKYSLVFLPASSSCPPPLLRIMFSHIFLALRVLNRLFSVILKPYKPPFRHLYRG